MKQIELFMRSLESEYDYTDKGDIKSYLGIDISEVCEGTFKLLQEPATPKEEILVHDEGEPRKTDWNYRSIVGQLN
jgi:hypothetical protein